uniref:STAS domain-containing protein n=1 Tax=Heliothis virescens TaxID=7102 RepID=A0A2A4JHT2_HELVI
MRPQVHTYHVKTEGGAGVRVRPAQGATYVCAALLARRVLRAAARAAPRPLLLDCACLALLDYAAMQVDVGTVRRLWASDRAELGVLALTFCVSIARSVELAVLAGALASLAALLRRLMRPQVHTYHVKTEGGAGVRVRPAQGATYVCAALLARRVLRAAARAAPRPLLLDCACLALLDYAAMQMLERLIAKFKANDQLLIIYNVPEELLDKYEQLAGGESAALLQPV